MDWRPATTKDDGTVSIPATWLHLHYYEALNILFRMENALRVFVYVVLKNKHKEKWAHTALEILGEEQSTIAATATKRVAQAKGFGYLGYEISSPLMYLNSGELTRLITSEAHWEVFRPFFRGKKEIIKTKLDEIGTVRNSLAHFRPIKSDDIELIKQNVRHAFVGIEQCLSEMTQTHRVVPTNTPAIWYKTLSTVGSGVCNVKLFQDKSGQWIRVELDYAGFVLQSGGGTYRSFTVTKLISPSVIRRFSNLARHCIFAKEQLGYPRVTENNTPEFRKRLSFTFSLATVLQSYSEIDSDLREVVLAVENETELLKQDNLARGELVDTEIVWAFQQESSHGKWWSVVNENLKCGFGEDDPPEYWGDIGYAGNDFVSESSKYPWMPSDVSKDEIPF